MPFLFIAFLVSSIDATGRAKLFFLVFNLGESLFFFKDAYSSFQLKDDRSSVESEGIPNTVFDVSRVGEVKMISVIDGDDEFRWVDVHLRSVKNSRFVRFAITGRRMIECNLLEEVVEFSGCHTLVPLIVDRERMIEDVVDPFTVSRDGKYRCDIGDESQLSLEILEVSLHNGIFICIRSSEDFVPLVDDEDNSLFFFQRL